MGALQVKLELAWEAIKDILQEIEFFLAIFGGFCLGIIILCIVKQRQQDRFDYPRNHGISLASSACQSEIYDNVADIRSRINNFEDRNRRTEEVTRL